MRINSFAQHLIDMINSERDKERYIRKYSFRPEGIFDTYVEYDVPSGSFTAVQLDIAGKEVLRNTVTFADVFQGINECADSYSDATWNLQHPVEGFLNQPHVA